MNFPSFWDTLVGQGNDRAWTRIRFGGRRDKFPDKARLKPMARIVHQKLLGLLMPLIEPIEGRLPTF